jgi:cell division protein FtsB
MSAVALRLTRPARIALVALALVAILFVVVFPVRSYWSQRRQVSAAQHDVDVLRRQNERLAQEAARLQTPSEIEREAREDFHMVRPGERAFVVTPAPAPASTTTVPNR